MEQIFEACTAAENPKPRIMTEPGGLWLEFPFAREQAAGGQISGAISGAIELSGRQKDILAWIRTDSKITYRHIAQMLEINDSAVIKHIKTLRDAGVLKRIGGTRGHWEIIT